MAPSVPVSFSIEPDKALYYESLKERALNDLLKFAAWPAAKWKDASYAKKSLLLGGFLYGRYLQWWLGLAPTNKESAAFWTFKLGKTAYTLLFFKTLYDAFKKYINCPKKRDLPSPASPLRPANTASAAFVSYSRDTTSSPAKPASDIVSLLDKFDMMRDGGFGDTLDLSGKGLTGKQVGDILAWSPRTPTRLGGATVQKTQPCQQHDPHPTGFRGFVCAFSEHSDASGFVEYAFNSTSELRYLNLSFSNAWWGTSTYFETQLAFLKKLQVLDLSVGSYESPDTLFVLSQSLSSLPDLRVLKLRNAFSQIPDDSIAHLINSLPASLRVFDFSKNRIQDPLATQAIVNLVNRAYLIQLDLRLNLLNEGLEELAKIIRNKPSLTTFYISQYNTLTDDVLNALRSAWNAREGRTDLNNLFTMKDIQEYLSKLSPSQNTIDLTNRMLYPTAEMMRTLLQGLPNTTTSLILRDNYVQCESPRNNADVTRMISEGVGRLPLETFDVSNNCIGYSDERMQFFGSALMSLKRTLKDLYLEEVFGSPQIGWDPLTPAMQAMNLTSLTLAFGNIPDNSSNFFRALGSQVFLKDFALAAGVCSIQFPDSLQDSIQNMTHLESLSLPHIGCQSRGGENIQLLNSISKLSKLNTINLNRLLAWGKIDVVSATANMFEKLKDLKSISLMKTDLGGVGADATNLVLNSLANLPNFKEGAPGIKLDISGMTNIAQNSPAVLALAKINQAATVKKCQDEMCFGPSRSSSSGSDSAANQSLALSVPEVLSQTSAHTQELDSTNGLYSEGGTIHAGGRSSVASIGQYASSLADSVATFASTSIAASVSYLGSDTSLPAPKAQTYLPYNGAGYEEDSLFSTGSSYTSFTPAKIIIMGVVAIALVYFLMKVLKKFTRSWATDRPLPSV
jgi:hypothetical protein